MITLTVSAVAGAVFAAFALVAWLPAWDRDRPPPPRHVRVPIADLIGGTP